MPGGTSSALLSYGLPFLVLILTWWFFIIRPQQAQERKRREMFDALKKGDQVVTIGGLFGTITEIRKDTNTVQLKIADRVEVQFLRSAIAEIRREKDKDKDADKAKE